MTTNQTLLGYKELAERWDVSADTLRVRKHRGGLPDPDIWVNNGPVWYETTIVAYECDHDFHAESVDGGGTIEVCGACGKISSESP